MPRINDESLTYKEKKVKGLLDRVTVSLTGTKSGVFTRIANRYKKIDRLIFKLQESREKLNEDVKNHIIDLFDAEDAVVTRVVESVSLTATLSKRTPAHEKEISDFDTEGFLEELYETLPDLEEQLRLLQEKYTTIEKIQVPEKSPALRVKLKENISQDLVDKLEDYSDLVYQKVERNLQKVDNVYDRIRNNL